MLIQSLFDKKMVLEMDELIEYGHKNGVKVIVEVPTPEEFEKYREIGLKKGFLEIVSGPMVRSSYRANNG